ncbi:nicotinate-nucleotide adenylyltransferase [bacterium]|nr:nicotinate-nucleotide adenylyltransferase [bacterium]
MRIGIFGGAFDPVHFGHLLLAEQCREQCGLDQVWFVPTKIPPHKPEGSLTDDKHRVEMLKLAIAGIPEFQVSRIELDRAAISWTVDTLRNLRSGRPDDEFFLLIGADSLRDFSTWREPDAIARLATIVAVNRGPVLPAELTDGVSETVKRSLQVVDIPGVDYSATDIRERVAEDRSIRFLVPRAVEVYIQQHGLYR